MTGLLGGLSQSHGGTHIGTVKLAACCGGRGRVAERGDHASLPQLYRPPVFESACLDQVGFCSYVNQRCESPTIPPSGKEPCASAGLTSRTRPRFLLAARSQLRITGRTTAKPGTSPLATSAPAWLPWSGHPAA